MAENRDPSFWDLLTCSNPRSVHEGAGEVSAPQQQRIQLLCMSVDCGQPSKNTPSKDKLSATPTRPYVPRTPLAKNAPGVVPGSAEKGSDPTLGGVGLVFQNGPIGSGLLVKSVVPGGAAEKAGGLLMGDEMVAIEGEDIRNMQATQLSRLLVGPVG
eukprot:CAMPEP_0206253914 /NCGR_PEP_ID=MMETSP0047_2-20121206/23411_1 /ASSEMBLY_ACC=CAM_ASM_000192 /TAXON_ID=195065 /ORGANISM="Chroomonas mesostigmatica_cf, Strain CCMP1168" /LENGTH=156 /DNA_ID=CAMNT_0053680165 /DNA_START=59 /DNA_END=525 /DNA_ORIENTATION=-